MRRRTVVTILAFVGATAASDTCRSQTRRAPDVACVLEDNADELLRKLTNPQGCPGEGHVERDQKFAGESCVRIETMQRYARSIPDWAYAIVEKPKAGEYRYLRFAWKSRGCSGIMLQLHDDKDWNIRYTAGVDKFGWGTKYITDKPPDEWTVVTVDLFKEFGARTIRGIALTCFDGEAGYFDHIYFGRTVDDLDRIDATDFAKKPREWTADELEAQWQQANARDDAAKAYHAFWALANARPAVPFLADKLRRVEARPNVEAIRKWIAELDDDTFAARQAAANNLAKHAAEAAALLEDALKTAESAELRTRIKQLLSRQPRADTAGQQALRAVRVLEMSTAVEAKEALGEVAKGRDSDSIAVAARDALKRIEAAEAR
jgi:hypothetical protein